MKGKFVLIRKQQWQKTCHCCCHQQQVPPLPVTAATATTTLLSKTSVTLTAIRNSQQPSHPTNCLPDHSLYHNSTTSLDAGTIAQTGRHRPIAAAATMIPPIASGCRNHHMQPKCHTMASAPQNAFWAQLQPLPLIYGPEACARHHFLW